MSPGISSTKKTPSSSRKWLRPSSPGPGPSWPTYNKPGSSWSRSEPKKISGKTATSTSEMPASSTSSEEDSPPSTTSPPWRNSSKRKKFTNHASRKSSKSWAPTPTPTLADPSPTTSHPARPARMYQLTRIWANPYLRPSSRRPPRGANTRTSTR